MPGKMKIAVLSVVAFAYFMAPIHGAAANRANIGDSCNTTAVCDSSVSLNCSNGKCICLNTHYPDTTCKPKVALKGNCTNSNQCSTVNSGCIKKACKCNEGYYENSGSCNKRIVPNIACGTNTNKNESCVLNAYCNGTHCVCGIGYTTTKDSCNSGLVVFAEVSILLFSMLCTLYGNN